MTIAEWFNSDPVKDFRRSILGDAQVNVCSRCYHEEKVGGNSRRFKSNQKSVIFRQAFDASFEQSPSRKYFDKSGYTDTNPIDIHIDLGNYCNLACKMCYAGASSKIASQEVRWGIESSRKYVGTDWTRDQSVWNNFKLQIVDIPNLKNIHLMGGETMLSDRFEDLVDTFIDHKKFDVCFSFVTNGTVLKPELIKKLKHFSRVGIEVSIETTTDHNSYVRQGTDTSQVLKNIQWYQSQCDQSNMYVTLRPAVSLLTIGYYSTLLEYAISNKLTIKSLLVTTPSFLNANNLPPSVKQQYSETFDSVLNSCSHINFCVDYNASDPNNYLVNIKEEAVMCKNLLLAQSSTDSSLAHRQLVDHCQKWDRVYGYNAKAMYPELKSIWEKYGY
jgi:sulfatase maturation enzyme AslB (radical SAM superfamily)